MTAGDKLELEDSGERWVMTTEASILHYHARPNKEVGANAMTKP